jgi:geranylgeranyl reductase family protein
MTLGRPGADADVIVVGAGPGGSSAAYHLARQGLHVLMLERSTFPRGKVCGDGLTPRSVQQVQAMGVDITTSGWEVNRGVRFIGGRARLELEWPDLRGTPGVGLTRTRLDFDALLAARATDAGAELCTHASVIGPGPADTTRGAVAVTAQVGPDGIPRTFRSSLVVVASGVSGRLPLALGFRRQLNARIGVAVRRYYRSVARHHDPFLEVVLDVPTSSTGTDIAPGYGWIFGLGDGRVNVGLAVYDSAGRYKSTDHRQVLRNWLQTTPPEWGLTDDANADGPLMGGAIPMGFTREPFYQNGVLLVGDCAGTASPWTGEGIAYAMESGALAADVAARALAVPPGPRREAALERYSAELSNRYANYYRLGRRFAELMDSGPALRFGIDHVLPHPVMMRLVFRLMNHLADPLSPEATDRIIAALARLTT